MAKRYADTALSKEKWYRQLSPVFKAAWRYLTDECDVAGVWSIDEEAIDFNVGAPVDIDQFLEGVNRDKERVRRLGSDKLYVTGFCFFQYSKKEKPEPLSDNCKAHQKAIARLKELNLWQGYLAFFDTLPKGYADDSGNLLGNGNGEGSGRGNGEGNGNGEGGSGETNAAAVIPEIVSTLTQAAVKACLEDWKKTLEHFEIDWELTGVGQAEELEIARCIQHWDAKGKAGATWVKLALAGAQKQKASKTWDPKQFVSLRSYLDPKRMERLVNIGAGKESAEGIEWENILGRSA
jgi:hypothetical protein